MIKNKFIHDRNMRIETIDTQLDYFSSEYSMYYEKHHSDNKIAEIEAEVKLYWKKLLQKRTQGVKDVSDSSYKRIVESIHYYSSKTSRYSVEYIPDGFFYSLIDPVFNSERFADQFDNKSYYPLIFHDVLQPKTIALRLGGIWFDHRYNVLSVVDVYNKCLNCPEIVVKYSRDSCGGTGVFFYSDYTKENLINIINVSSVDMIIQEPIVQHDCLSQIHENSVNTIRLVTLLFHNKTLILSSVLRMGIGDMRKDNASSGGIVCGINNDGSLKDVAFDKHGNMYLSHPQGARFSKATVPSFFEIKKLAKNLQYRFPYCKMISWDFAIDKMGNPILVEANMKRGEIDFHQFCNGPLFGSMTSQIIGEAIERYL